MTELTTILAAGISIAVIILAVRIYKECPRISKNIGGDDPLN